MRADAIEGFLERLIKVTEEKKAGWNSLGTLHNWSDIRTEMLYCRNFTENEILTVNIAGSYYLKSNGGYVFLLETSGNRIDNIRKLILAIKINDEIAPDNLTYDVEEQRKQLKILQILIENYRNEKYPFPETFNEFLFNVIEDLG